MSYRSITVHPEARVASNATVVGNVSLDKDAVVLFGATLRGDCGGRIEVGEGANIQEGACLHVSRGADCILGRGVTVGHGAVVHGCVVGDNTLVGMGAVVMDRAVVGRDCLVAAGALVTGGTVVPDGSLVMGSPAKVRRPLSPQEVERIRESAEEYVQIGKDLAAEGIIYDGASIPKGLMTIPL